MAMSDSFTSYRKPSDDLLTSDEEVVNDSFQDSPTNKRQTRSRFHRSHISPGTPQASIEVEDSSNSDEEPILKPKTRNRPRFQLISDDEDTPSNAVSANDPSNMSNVLVSEESGSSEEYSEEEVHFEKRALSPKTRMSITGFRPRDMSDDDSDYFIDDPPGHNSNHVKRSMTASSNTESEQTSEQMVEKDKSSIFSDDEVELHSFNAEEPPQEASVDVSKPTNDSTDGKLYPSNHNSHRLAKSDIAPRMSTNFNTSIVNKLSSTIIGVNFDKKQSESGVIICDDSPTLESPITLLTRKGETIEISSGSDASLGSTSTPTRSKNFIQPKIIGMLVPKSEQNSRLEASQSDYKYVSQLTYEAELKKLSDLKSELSICENLISTVGSKLPDKGKRMSGRGDKLKEEIAQQARYLTTLKVRESIDRKKISTGPSEVSEIIEKKKISIGASESGPKLIETPTWEELNKAVNTIQPTHTGKVGMANFAAAKTLTLERLKDIHGSIETCPGEDVLAEDPKYLKTSLMIHQKHALAWMNWREKQKPRGGILADDMGLGKTLTMIALVLASNYGKEAEEESSEAESDDENSDSGWSQKGKRECFYGGTLVVCPASLIRQWEGEIHNFVRAGKLCVYVHHGANREEKSRRLAKNDIVVTTYNLISREYNNGGTLYGVNWERIILDEAHIIRNHKSKVSEAACKLKGKRRWALTGTPIQNREMDLYALMKFLKCSPFDDLRHWKTWIDNKSGGGQQRLNTLMKSLMLRRTKAQLQGHGNFFLPEKTYEVFEMALDKDEMAVYQKVMLYSRSLFAQFLQQRAEKNNDYLYSNESNRPTFLQTRAPNQAYLKMHERFARLDRRTEVKSHEILVLLLRLRQICCHPGLIDSMLEDDSDGSTTETYSSGNQSQEIDLLEQISKLKISNDSHGAMSESLDGSKEEAISKALSKALLKSNPVFDLSRPSSKMRKVIECASNILKKTSDKLLIVSQWTSVLNILQGHFARKGIDTVSLNGSVPINRRNGIVNDFNNQSSTKKVMLLSLTAGGVGLNLTGANHLLLIDLHWNPQLEAQAQDRIFRVGQKKQVRIYKFLCKETVEERIKALQDVKIQIANGVLTGTKGNVGSKLTIDDLKSLFGFNDS